MTINPWIFGLVLAAGPLAADEPAAPAPAPSQKTIEPVRAACQTDIQTLCPSVQPGGGRILACLKEHKDEISAGCKQAFISARQKSN